ncbi:LacI family DNA-binding transcriptional regulator [Methylibium sp. Pch-M]|uniref:LacI family DNA-binding transcriptional regulator n=1 Tax=unclassified Methylibium TaxID=2633235 RepID=UPI0003F3DCCA|nr:MULTISPECIES: LacI family DNA-binding transcriptional regulator [unclassified Methylibium]EWS53213.1 Gluconate utilization system GNT-I transcriptional repressor [Methylibium sp. T29]QAZ38729.1 LacI family DNA-binding transcriptional regulator [Methylibium sp. Pch-M]
MTAPDATAPRRSRRGGGITLGDVARLAGVSPITASRALNTPDQVAPDKLARVREAVARTGYVPNRLAGGLASARSRLVAAVVPTIAGPVFMEMVQSLTSALADAGYQLMLGQSGYTESREDALLEAIIGRRPDGIVLTGILHSPEGRRRLLASGIPVVETWDLTPTPIDMLVGFSHAEAAAAVARHLHAKGRRHPALLSADDERALRRNRGFVDEALRLGLVRDAAEIPVLRVPAPTTLGSGRSGLARLLAERPEVDAVFCSSDMLALGVLIEAAARGIAVPRQLAVVGFGDLGFAADTQPALSTVRIDGTGIGQRAARFIVDRADGRAVGEKIVDVGFRVIERGSS